MHRFIYDLSIKNKLITIILATTTVVLFLSASILVTNEVFSIKRNLSSDLLTLADIMGINASVGLIFDNPQAAEDNLASLKAKSNIIMAHVFDIDGNIFASYHREELNSETQQTDKQLSDFYAAYDTEALSTVEEAYFFDKNHIDVFKSIILDEELLGTVYILSDLEILKTRLYWYGGILIIVMFISLIVALLLAAKLQRIITTPIYDLLKVTTTVSKDKDYTIRAKKLVNDEVGTLIDEFNKMLVNIESRDKEILSLNKQLDSENQRMSAELDVTKELQQMVLPATQELKEIEGLEIAGFMEPADEVGGDYYDVLSHDGHVKIGIGDVTGHGLESGVLMLMVQTTVRALLLAGIHNPEDFMNIVNRTVYHNVRRMETDKKLTLSLLDYQAGTLRLTGQHEEVLVVRKNREIERIDTIDLGVIVGMMENISRFISCQEIKLEAGDGIVLYTDGITEAGIPNKECYGVERLCDVVSRHWHESTLEVRQAVVEDVKQYIGDQKMSDDITLLVLKQKA
jgi:serine phosphatase RsbU (regulator of sigma subunit)